MRPIASLRLVVFVEDPGAVNCIAPLVQTLVAGETPVAVLAAGLAPQLLAARRIDFTSVESARNAREILAASRANCLVVATSENLDSLAFELTAEARAIGIPTVALIDFGANAAFRFRGRTDRPLAHAPDYLLVPDRWAAREFAAIDFPPERMGIVGHPHHDYIREAAERLTAVGRDAIREMTLSPAARNRTVLLFASELSTGLDPQQFRRSEEYTLHGRGAAVGRSEIVVEEVLDALSTLELEGAPRPYRVLRQHPKESSEDLAAYHCEFDEVSTGGDPLPLLYASDLVVGMSSMLLTESHLLGRTTVSVLPRPFEREWLPLVRTGAIPCATERGQLRRVLAHCLLEAASVGGAMDVSRPGDPRTSVSRIAEFLCDVIGATDRQHGASPT